MAHPLHNSKSDNHDGEVTDTDDRITDPFDTQRKAGEAAPANGPLLFHKVKNEKSILAIIISNARIFAGTQGGELLVRHDGPTFVGCR